MLLRLVGARLPTSRGLREGLSRLLRLRGGYLRTPIQLPGVLLHGKLLSRMVICC